MPTDPAETLDQTLASPDDSLLSDTTERPPVLGLAVLWSRDEPDRIGDVYLIPPGGGILGRDHPGADASALRPVQQRPGSNAAQPPLRSRRISRRQLQLRPAPGGLQVENLGAAALRLNGREADRGLALPGDVVELHRELLLLCVERPQALPASEVSAPAFGRPDGAGIVGESPAVWELRARLALIAETSGHVLVRGPSGAGKELAARAIHSRSRAARPMVSRNAATFPEGLIDAELFGNARNYPNPGTPARLGAVGEADGGTLFLDEIGEVSHEVQAHLLRVLDSGEYQRLGEDRRRRSQFRLIGATNRAEEALKHDFLARLSRRVELPGLGSRREDVPLLARHLLEKMHEGNPGLFPDSGPPRLHPSLVRGLTLHDYTTHTRELHNLLWQAVERWKLSGGGKYMDLELPEPARLARRALEPAALTREAILAAYRECGGVQARVVASLGLKNRFQLGRLEKKLGITAADRAGAVG